jgi:hypothetical protein
MFSKKSEEPTTRLRELSSSDFVIAKGQSDIRGWDVRDASGRKYGSVLDLIFDIRTGKVRYMVLGILDTKELELEKRTVLVPIGLAELDPNDNDVLLPTVNPFQLRALPRYDRSTLGAKTERDISFVFGRQTQGDATQETDEQFYNHDHFNQDNLYRRRVINPSHTKPLHEGTTEKRLQHRTDGSIHSNAAQDGQNSNQNNHHTYGDETDEAYFRRTGRRRTNL